ncbi:nucleoside recognition domain-containing protein [Sneathiella sp.]|uniref:nucleoside recognition domain-containing protein n=1 Tax=Sneathiella sp. TaxID=1964365 RepID=UPI0039E3FDDE
MNAVLQALKEIFRESLIVYWGLLKIMVPVMVIVEIGVRLGVVEIISKWCAPIMSVFGLPAELSLVLATNLIVGLYGAGAALVTLAPGLDLTVENMTVLAGMLLFAHALPVEQTIVKKTGTPLIFSIFTRVFAAGFYGWIMHVVYQFFGALDGPATILITAGSQTGDTSWMAWGISSLTGLISVFGVLVFLITLLRVLEYLGITKLITRALTPALRLMGVGPNAAPLAMIGILLGLSFGGALILREVEKGALQPRSIFISMIFMGLCHSLIEDTIIAIAYGGHWSGVLVGRLVISILLILPISFYVLRVSDKTFFRYWYSRKSSP